jgi:flagellar FliJ protein
MAHRFRLETLLKIRITTRDEKYRALGQALDAAAILAKQRAQLVAEQELTRAWSVEKTSAGSVNVDECLNAGRYQLLLKAQLVALARQEKQVADEVERRRQQLIEADKQVRMLEKLRERQQARERVAEEKKLMKELDEIAVQRFVPPEEVTA